jgi:hypothetical protein
MSESLHTGNKESENELAMPSKGELNVDDPSELRRAAMCLFMDAEGKLTDPSPTEEEIEEAEREIRKGIEERRKREKSARDMAAVGEIEKRLGKNRYSIFKDFIFGTDELSTETLNAKLRELFPDKKREEMVEDISDFVLELTQGGRKDRANNLSEAFGGN